jgi:hypothetical protein
MAMSPSRDSFTSTQNSTMMLRATSNSILGFEAQTSQNRPRSQHVSSSVLDRPIIKSFVPRLNWSTIILTSSTRPTPPHVHLLVDVPKCHPPTISLTALGPSLSSILHRSQSIGTTRPYLMISIAINCLCAPHLRITSQETVAELGDFCD